MFSFRYHCQDFYRTLTMYMSNSEGVLWKEGTAYLSQAPEFTPVFWWARVAHLYGFLCCAIMCLYVMSSLLWCPLRFPHKNDVWFVFASSCLFVCLNYLRCLCLSACDGVRHVLCCVFLRIVCPVLPFSLDCPFLIAPSVFSNVYLKTLKWLCWVFVLFFFVLCALCCQFLSIVHF